MDNVGHTTWRKRTREGTYQLKRRRLKPDVRDPLEDVGADVDMADIYEIGWKAIEPMVNRLSLTSKSC